MANETRNEEAIFTGALEQRTPEERAAYLAEACGGDGSLHESVEELLEAHDNPVVLLDVAALGIDSASEGSSAVEGPGTQIGHYKLLQEIGEGGFGVVYMAEQQEPVIRKVALKIIKLGMDTRQVIARFEAERQALAMMDHPNIAKVLDGGATDTGRPYFVMELVRGIPITEYCDKNNLTTNERLALFVNVCRAVQHAHQKGIIHRDIKPTNVMVTLHDGQPMPKVIDFGIAKATRHRLTEKTLYTDYRQFLGTPQYMSPEQATMSDRDVDTRTDIYSLGVLIYELLVGSTPFQPKQLREVGYDEICRIIRENDPPTPSRRFSTLGQAATTEVSQHRQAQPAALRRLLRGDLDWIVMKALEKDRNRRYETANDFAADVERCLNNEPVEARHPSAAYTFGKFAAQPDHADDGSPYSGGPVDGHHICNGGGMRFSGLAEETRNQLYDADMNRVPQLIEDGDFARAIRILDSHRPRHKQADLRGMEWFMYRQKCEASSHTLSHERFAHCGEYSPNGRILATAGNPSQIHLWQADTLSNLLTLKPGHRSIRCLAFRSDDELISAGAVGKIGFWDVRSGNPTRTALDISAPTYLTEVSSLALSPDGSKLAAGYDINGILYPSGKPGRATVWDLNSDKVLAHLDDLTGGVHAITFSSDGEQLVVGDETGRIRIWRASDWKLEKTVDAHSEGVFCLALSPDGKLLTTGSGIRNGKAIDQGEIKIWDMTTWHQEYRFSAHANRIRSLDFSNDGTLIAGSADGRISLWDTATGHQRLSFGAHTEEIISVRFSPQGQRICSASMDSTARIWNVPTLFTSLRESVVYRGHDAVVAGVAFMQGGQKACTIDRFGRFHIWDTRTGDTTARRDEVLGIIAGLAVSRDSRVLAIATSTEPFGEGRGLIRLFDTTDLAAIPQQPLWQHELQNGFMRGIEFSPDGTTIAYSTGNDVQVRKVSTGKLVATFGPLDDSIWDLRLSRDGSKVGCTTAGGSTYVLRTRDLELVHRFKSDGGGTYCVDFSPDGKTLITGGEDSVIKTWDASSFQQLGDFEPCTSSVSCLRYSPDGTRVVSSTVAGTVQIWRTQTGTSVFEARDRTSALCVNLTISRDGLLFASGEGAMRVWRVPKSNTVFQMLRPTK